MQLPQHIAVQIDGRQAADEAVGVAGDALLHLRQHHLPAAIAQQVPEAQLAAGAERTQIDLLPQLHGGMAGHFSLFARQRVGLALPDGFRLLRRDKHLNIRKAGGAVRREGDLAAARSQRGIGFQHGFAVDQAADMAAVNRGAQTVFRIAVGGIRGFAQDDDFLLVAMSQLHAIGVFKAEHQCVDGVIHAQRHARHAAQGQSAHRGGKGIIAPARAARLQRGEHAVRVILFDAHAFDGVAAVLLRDEPRRAVAAPVVVAHLIHPRAMIAFFHDVVVFARSGMVGIIGEFADGKAAEILRKQHVVFHIVSSGNEKSKK